jgi:hypothetical protein
VPQEETAFRKEKSYLQDTTISSQVLAEQEEFFSFLKGARGEKIDWVSIMFSREPAASADCLPGKNECFCKGAGRARRGRAAKRGYYQSN